MNTEERLARLEAQVFLNKKNLARGKNAKAILVLGVVVLMVFEFDSPLPGGGRFKSSRLGLPEVGQILLLGAWAIGSIALEDIVQIRTSKLSAPSDTKAEREE